MQLLEKLQANNQTKGFISLEQSSCGLLHLAQTKREESFSRSLLCYHKTP